MMDDQQVNENDNDNIDHNTQNNNNNKSISSIIIEYLSFVLPRSCRYKYQAPYSPPYYRGTYHHLLDLQFCLQLI